MTTKTGAAALTSQATMTIRAGFSPMRDGILDETSGTVKAQGTGRWGGRTSWATFTSYVTQRSPIIWTAPVIDIGEIRWFTIAIAAEFDGDCEFLIHVSETGQFAGEETETLIQNGNYDITAFYGRYVYVTARVTGAELRRMQITTSNETKTYSLYNINSSTLLGSSAARIIPLPQPVSKILDIKISAQAPTAYPVNLYVSDTATSNLLIPIIVSKDDAVSDSYFVDDYIASGYFSGATTPSFALRGIDNDLKDGIVDISITALPRQAMIGGNLLVIA
jgi:hypothetical protein